LAKKEKLSHLDEKGQAHMVDISGKEVTERMAKAQGELHISAKTLKLLLNDGLPKGDVLAVARVAGIQAAKNTSDLIPLCHPIATRSVKIGIKPEEKSNGDGVIHVECIVKVSEKTGAEMEALTGVTATLLTLYDMMKAVQKDMKIQNVRLREKTGGKSGDLKFE